MEFQPGGETKSTILRALPFSFRSLFMNDPFRVFFQSFKNKIGCVRSQNYHSLFKICLLISKSNLFLKSLFRKIVRSVKNEWGFFPIFSTICSFSFFKFIQTILNNYFFFVFKNDNFFISINDPFRSSIVFIFSTTSFLQQISFVHKIYAHLYFLPGNWIFP